MKHMLIPCKTSSMRRAEKLFFHPCDSHDICSETKSKLVKIVNTPPLYYKSEGVFAKITNKQKHSGRILKISHKF